LSAGDGQEAIFAAFLDELSDPPHRLGPMVVEDARRADEATLDWLALLGRRTDRLSVLLVVTYRDDEMGPEHPLLGVLGSLPAARFRRVVVPALSRECVLERARLAGRDAQSVYGSAGGNALLVTELLKSEVDEVPGAVQDLILGRIRALPTAARDVAHLVAVMPTRADTAVTGKLEDVDACIAARVLVPAGDRWLSGTSGCAARSRTPCLAAGEPSCTGGSWRSWWPSRVSTPAGWCTMRAR